VETLHLAALCGFIHVPMPSHMPKGTGPQQRYSIYDLLRAVEVCVDYLVSVLNKGRPIGARGQVQRVTMKR
jgi:hypothetical protein